MAKVISQETYDDIIKENVVEFSMSINEARQESINQLEAQGVSLSNIIKDMNINESTGVPVLTETIELLKAHSDKSKILKPEELHKSLDVLMTELCQSVPHRVLAAKNNLLNYLLIMIDTEITLQTSNKDTDEALLHKLILCAHALINQNPDIFDCKSMEIIMRLLESQTTELIICDTLKWIQKSCLLHEMNRQAIMNEDALLGHFKKLVTRSEPSIIKNVCITFRYLILDDDIRVEFGKAHDHARLIAQEYLVELTKLLKTFLKNMDVVSELMLTVAALCVRNEYCQSVSDAGGLTMILDAMVEHPDSIKTTREALKLLKALAGNDKVKTQIIEHGAAQIVCSALSKFKLDETVAKHALICISTLALRMKENSEALFEAGLPDLIIETMKIHEKNKVIQRNGAWAIRNMVSRSREQCEYWLKLGAEDVLNNALTLHPTMVQDIKSALRDLGTKVFLNEEWKGTAEKVIN